MLYVKMQTGNSEEGYCSRLEKNQEGFMEEGMGQLGLAGPEDSPKHHPLSGLGRPERSSVLTLYFYICRD